MQPIITDELARQAAEYLQRCDPALKPVIKQAGLCTIRPHQDYYRALVRAIVGQQLSVKAAASIFNRFLMFFSDEFPAPEQILQTPDEDLRSVGLSGAKVKYVKDLAQHIAGGKSAFDKFDSLSDEAIIQTLTDVKGIGEWSAQIFLMFCLGRPNILPAGDLGIRTAVKRLYVLESLPAAPEIKVLSQKHHWQPYQSIVSWYLWRLLDNEPK